MAATWIQKRAEFQKRFDELSQVNFQGLITDLNTAVGNFISKGGLSQDPNNNPDYDNIQALLQKVEYYKLQYLKLNEDIQTYLTKQATDNNLGSLLAENGELQKQINKLDKISNEMKVDVESAVARDKLLRSRNTDITRHQLFILDRPIRRGLIPYLWVISVLFIGVGLIIFRMTLPTVDISMGTTTGMPGTGGILGLVKEFLFNKIVLGSLLISALITIIFLALKIAGVFGQ